MAWEYYKSHIKINGTIKLNGVKSLKQKLRLKDKRRNTSMKVFKKDEYQTYLNLRFDSINGNLCEDKRILYNQLKIKQKFINK